MSGIISVRVNEGDQLKEVVTPSFPIRISNIRVVDDGLEGSILLNPQIREKDGAFTYLLPMGLFFARDSGERCRMIESGVCCDRDHFDPQSVIRLNVLEATKEFTVEIEYAPYLSNEPKSAM